MNVASGAEQVRFNEATLPTEKHTQTHAPQSRPPLSEALKNLALALTDQHGLRIERSWYVLMRFSGRMMVTRGLVSDKPAWNGSSCTTAVLSEEWT